MVSSPVGKVAEAQVAPQSNVTAWTSVCLLSLVYFMGTLDRQIVYLLSEPIKRDLGLTDVQVSLIQGLAFGGLYMLAMLPVGWLVDNYRRKIIISLGAIVWSIGAIASGLSRSFLHLFGARAVVGGGEASILPASYSIIADYFPVNRLALPMCVFTIGGTLGAGMSMLGGGLLLSWVAGLPPIMLPGFGPLAGWQLAFVVTGIPSFLFALLVLLVREPARRRAPDKTSDRSSLGDLFAHYRKYPRFYLSHTFGFSLTNGLMVGLLAWVPAFLSRAHGWNFSQIGLWLGGGQLVVGLLGIAFHGAIVDRMFNRTYKDAHLRYFVGMAMLSGVLAVLAFTASDARLCAVLYVLSFFCIIGYPGISAACLQMATPPRLRGQASAVFLTCNMVVGTIAGPFIVALLTDHVFGNEASLGYSMIAFAIGVSLSISLVFAYGLSAMRRIVGAATE